MNNNLKRILPKDWKSYTVSYDEELLKICQDIWERNEDNLTARCEVDGFVYRSVAELFKDNISNEKIQDYFGNSKVMIAQAEHHFANPISSKYHLLGDNRVSGIKKDMMVWEELENHTLDHYISSFWHCDFGLPLNNFSSVVYLSDVDKDMGGTILSDPPIVPTYDEKTKETTIFDDDTYNKWNSEEIPQIEITGPAGTVVAFNSHRLHRASLPSRGYRKTISMWAQSPLEEHRANPYVYSNCKPHRTLESL
jgi:hypothetical protein